MPGGRLLLSVKGDEGVEKDLGTNRQVGLSFLNSPFTENSNPSETLICYFLTGYETLVFSQ